MSRRFVLAIAFYNCLPGLKACLASVAGQEGLDFELVIVDDCSDCEQASAMAESFTKDFGGTFLRNSQNEGAGYSYMRAIDASKPDDDTVISILDGDDWLSRIDSLATVAKVYRDHDVELTFGTFETYPPGRINRQFYRQHLPRRVIFDGLQRQVPYIFCHMQTFSGYLWRHLDKEDLKRPDGTYYRVSGDRARFYPLLEMAGFHIYRIRTPIYIYNTENPESHFRRRPQEQQKVVKEVIEKKPYASLFPGENGTENPQWWE